MKFRVHGRHDTIVPVPAVANDIEITGNMPASIIELVPVDAPWQGTLTITRITPTEAEKEAAIALFPIDGLVELGEFTPA